MNNLSSAKIKACELIVAGLKRAEICEQLQISRATLYTWRQDEDFKNYLYDLLVYSQEESRERLASLQEQALLGITELMKSESEAVRLKAYSFILSQSQMPIRYSLGGNYERAFRMDHRR